MIAERTSVLQGAEDPGVLAAYPTLRAAARILGVDPSALSKKKDLPTLARGEERRFPPALVLELARHYNRRALAAVASDLLDYAYANAEDYARFVDDEIEAAMGPSPATGVNGDAFLAEAQRALPGDLFAAVLRAYRASGGTSSITDRRSRRERGSVAHRG
jgi:hypothetical protein